VFVQTVNSSFHRKYHVQRLGWSALKSVMFAYVICNSLGVLSQPIVLLLAPNQSANQRVRFPPANPTIICYARSSLRKLFIMIYASHGIVLKHSNIPYQFCPRLLSKCILCLEITAVQYIDGLIVFAFGRS
jgi:hypothetical protein